MMETWCFNCIDGGLVVAMVCNPYKKLAKDDYK